MYEQSATAGDPLGGLFGLLIMAAIYLYFTFSMFKVAQKLNTPNAFFAFIPILNIWLLCEMAGKSPVWILGLLVPFVNIIVAAILWMEVAKNVNKSPVLGFLMILPLINFIAIGVLAFSGGGSAPRADSPFPPHHHDQPKQPQNVG